MGFHYNFPPCMVDLTKYDGDKSSCCYVVAIDAIDIIEPACSQFGGNPFVADKVMLSEAVLCHGDHRSRINGVILRFVELQCKPNAKQARLFC